MSFDIHTRPRLTPTSLIDEVMSIFARSEDALLPDSARATWPPRTTLATLTGSLNGDSYVANDRSAA
jgi:hypothetical protein